MIAVLVNQYPKITHTFVRTEIRALESVGVALERIAIRRSPLPLLDSADREESGRTHVLLDVGILGLLAASIRVAAKAPSQFCRALATAVRIGRGSDRGVARHLAYLAEACVLRLRCAEARLHHVHAHFGENTASVALFCRMLGGPTYSFTAHGPDEFAPLHAGQMQFKVENASFTVVVSEAGRKELARLVPQCRGRMHLVRCAVDPRFARQSPPPVPLARRIVFVGRLHAVKAPLLLLDAVARVVGNGEACELVMVGDGPLREAVEARIRTSGLGEHVSLVGWAGSDEVRRHLAEARALVLPSWAEGLPLVLMEAFAMHRPAICTAVGGVAELVEAGLSGWLVAPGSVDELAAAIGAVLDASPAELERMGRRGAEVVRRQHDAVNEAQKLAALFSRYAGVEGSSGSEWR